MAIIVDSPQPTTQPFSWLPKVYRQPTDPRMDSFVTGVSTPSGGVSVVNRIPPGLEGPAAAEWIRQNGTPAQAAQLRRDEYNYRANNGMNPGIPPQLEGSAAAMWVLQNGTPEQKAAVLRAWPGLGDAPEVAGVTVTPQNAANAANINGPVVAEPQKVVGRDIGGNFVHAVVAQPQPQAAPQTLEGLGLSNATMRSGDVYGAQPGRWGIAYPSGGDGSSLGEQMGLAHAMSMVGGIGAVPSMRGSLRAVQIDALRQTPEWKAHYDAAMINGAGDSDAAMAAADRNVIGSTAPGAYAPVLGAAGQQAVDSNRDRLNALGIAVGSTGPVQGMYSNESFGRFGGGINAVTDVVSDDGSRVPGYSLKLGANNSKYIQMSDSPLDYNLSGRVAGGANAMITQADAAAAARQAAIDKAFGITTEGFDNQIKTQQDLNKMLQQGLDDIKRLYYPEQKPAESPENYRAKAYNETLGRLEAEAEAARRAAAGSPPVR